MSSSLSGVVTEFDEARGLGTVEAGGIAYPFHCTQIADGTRTIAVDAAVTFEVAPGHLGRCPRRAFSQVPTRSPSSSTDSGWCRWTTWTTSWRR